jgi:glycosyltransferase involved in cell wall biosynthesis
MRGLSVCYIVKDEERLLSASLDSVKRVADEIVIGIDSKTTDRTESIARAAGARIHHFDWQDDFAAARNIGLRKAKREWIFVIDADERLSDFGAAMVTMAMRQPHPEVDGYAFMTDQRRFDGIRATQDNSVSVRLFRNDPSIRYENRVHEQVRKNGKPIAIGRFLKAPGLIHYGYDRDLYRERGKHERNLALLQSCLAANPDDRMMTYHMARQFYAVGEMEQAREWARRALTMTGEIVPGGVALLERLAT